MGWFTKSTDKAHAAVNRVSGRSDLLEAMCSAAALGAASDGSIGDNEIVDAVNVCKNNEKLSAAFGQAEIEAAMNKQIARANGGFSGKAALWKEIGEVAKNPEDAEAVFLMALDVVNSDGTIDEKEMAFVNKLGKTLGLDAKNYLDG